VRSRGSSVRMTRVPRMLIYPPLIRPSPRTYTLGVRQF